MFYTLDRRLVEDEIAWTRFLAREPQEIADALEDLIQRGVPVAPLGLDDIGTVERNSFACRLPFCGTDYLKIDVTPDFALKLYPNAYKEFKAQLRDSIDDKNKVGPLYIFSSIGKLFLSITRTKVAMLIRFTFIYLVQGDLKINTLPLPLF